MDFLGSKIEDARGIVTRAILTYNPDVILVGLSGGTDSITVAQLMLEFKIPFVAFLLDTGIKIQESTDFTKKWCADHSVELKLQSIQHKWTYEYMVLRNGFPGAAVHDIFFVNLKEKQINDLVRNYKRPIVLTGVRKAESKRRMKNVTKEVNEYQNKIYVSPIMNWTGDDKEEYIEGRCPINPVYSTLDLSGDCVCGCYAMPGEKEKIDSYYPVTGKQIDELQERAFRKGFTWGWEEQRPEEREYLVVMESIYPGYTEKYKKEKLEKQLKKRFRKNRTPDIFQPMCYKCDMKFMTHAQKEQFKTNKP